MAKYNPNRKIITGPNTVFAYLHVQEPWASAEGAAEKYSVCLIISKDDLVTVEKFKNGTVAAYEDGEHILKGGSKTAPPLDKLHVPLRDGDEDRPNDPAFHNCWFVNATCRDKPRVVNAWKKDITDPNEIYSGIKGRASVDLYAYNKGGSRGIACGLNSLQKLEDGTPLCGKSRPEDDFPDPDSEEDFLS